MNDLISNNFADNVNRRPIKKTFVVIKVALFLSIGYALLELVNWYMFLIDSPLGLLTNLRFYYYYITTPIASIILLIIGISNLAYCTKANKLIHLSFEKNDADLFNNGYWLFYKASILVCVSISISIGLMLMNIIFKMT